MKSKEELKKIAQEIFALENEHMLGKDEKSITEKIEVLVSTLTFEEMMAIDGIVQELMNQ